MSVDQTFHTPSFGDEAFDFSSLAYTPNATRYNGLAKQIPVEYLKRKLTSDPFCVYPTRQETFSDCRHYNQQPLSHFRPPESGYRQTSGMNGQHFRQTHGGTGYYQDDRVQHSMNMQMQYDGHSTYQPMESPQMSLMGPPQPTFAHMPMNAQGASPNGSTHNSPALETSEDSDDSTPLAQLMGTLKRPGPEPVEVGVRVPKKPKAPKKKKKRDPNEPQKPVSAYALFFRDTQAAIKGQNPNASFGEVSKIVAAMWDSLDAESKANYKQKTEKAKKEYLKQLAAYRATLVSKAAVDQSEPMYSPPPSGSPNGPLQRKHSPVLIDSMQPVVHSLPQQGWQMQSPQHLNNNTSPPQGISGGNNGLGVHPVSPQQMSMLGNSMAPMGSPPMGNSASNSPTYNQNMVSSPNNLPPNNLSHCAGEPLPQTCLRNGCSNLAIDSADWDREYCSSECVVSHCKDVFANWVTQRQMSANAYSTVN